MRRRIRLQLESLEARHLLTTWPFTTLPVSIVESNSPLSGELVDLDGDRDMDVVSVSRADGEVAWYKNLDRKGTYGRKISIFNSNSLFTNVSFARGTDIDGDGDQDVLFVAQSVGDPNGVDRLLWLENDGKGNFLSVHGSTELRSEYFEIHDLDGDGDQDVLGVGRILVGKQRARRHGAPRLSDPRATDPRQSRV